MTVFGRAVSFKHVLMSRGHFVGEESSEASTWTKVVIVAPRDEHRSRTDQIPIRMFSKKYSNDVFVTMRRQRLCRFRRMLITRSDDGYFGKILKRDSLSHVSISKKPMHSVGMSWLNPPVRESAYHHQATAWADLRNC